MSDGPFTRAADRVRFAVRVTPNSSRDALVGAIATADGRSALSVRLTARPVEGAANKALIAYLAKLLKVPKSAVRIVGGQSNRLKLVEVDSVSDEVLARLLA